MSRLITAEFGRTILPPKYARAIVAPFQGHANPMLALAQSEGHCPAPVPKPPRGGVCKPITIRGVEYPSRMDAAMALGVSEATVASAVKAGKADSIGMPKAGTEVVYNGVTYPSITAARKALGVGWRTLQRRIAAANAQVAK